MIMDYHFNLRDILNTAEEKEIDIDTLYLFKLTSYLVTKNILTGYEIRELCEKILNYMYEKQQKTNEEFVEYLKNSKVLRNKRIDYALIQKEYDAEKKDWKELKERL